VVDMGDDAEITDAGDFGHARGALAEGRKRSQSRTSENGSEFRGQGGRRRSRRFELLDQWLTPGEPTAPSSVPAVVMRLPIHTPEYAWYSRPQRGVGYG
jgi:hypothetical protein